MNEGVQIRAKGCELGIGGPTLEPVSLNPYNSSELRIISPMKSFARHNPLTDDEFAHLDSFLGKNMKAMILEQIDGFFTALVRGPEVEMPGNNSNFTSHRTTISERWRPSSIC